MKTLKINKSSAEVLRKWLDLPSESGRIYTGRSTQLSRATGMSMTTLSKIKHARGSISLSAALLIELHSPLRAEDLCPDLAHLLKHRPRKEGA